MAQREQVMRLAVAEQNLTEPTGNSDDQHNHEEDGQDTALPVIATARPAIQRADDQDRDKEQVEALDVTPRRSRRLHDRE